MCVCFIEAYVKSQKYIYAGELIWNVCVFFLINKLLLKLTFKFNSNLIYIDKYHVLAFKTNYFKRITILCNII